MPTIAIQNTGNVALSHLRFWGELEQGGNLIESVGIAAVQGLPTRNAASLLQAGNDESLTLESGERVMKRHRDVLRKLAEYDAGD